MANANKILTYETNGVELADPVEILLTASAIPSATTGLVATDVSAALQELQNNAAAKVFGNNYTSAISLAVSTNNSTTVYVTKLTMVTASLPSGTYMLNWSFKLSSSTAAREADIRVLDGVTTLTSWVPSFSRLQETAITAGYDILSGVSGVKTYKLEFKANNATTISMSDAQFAFWRLA